jgi:hypothetical protein
LDAGDLGELRLERGDVGRGAARHRGYRVRGAHSAPPAEPEGATLRLPAGPLFAFGGWYSAR